MQSIKVARKKSKDPKQESIRSEKDQWNKEVSKVIDDIIHFKKMMNGYPSKFYQERSKITSPIPIEPSKILSMISSEFASLTEKANLISNHQSEYSRAKLAPKQASNKFTRFFSYLKGPFFGSSPEALTRRDRVALLKYSSDIYYAFKDLNSEVLKRDTNSIHSSKAIFNKLSGSIYTFGTFFKSVSPEEFLKEDNKKIEPKKIEKENVPDNKENIKQQKQNEEDALNSEINNLFEMYSKDHQLIFGLFEEIPEYVEYKGKKSLINSSKASKNKLLTLLTDKFSVAFQSKDIKSKKNANEVYQLAIGRIVSEINQSFDLELNINTAERIFNWLKEQPDYQSMVDSRGQENNEISELKRKNEEFEKLESDIKLKKKDFVDNFNNTIVLLKLININVSNLTNVDQKELIKKSDIEFNEVYNSLLARVKNSLLFVNTNLFQKTFLEKIKNIDYMFESFGDFNSQFVENKIESKSQISNIIQNKEISVPNKITNKDKQEAIKKDIEENAPSLFRKLSSGSLPSRLPQNKSFKYSRYYMKPGGQSAWDSYLSDTNILNLDLNDLIKQYKELLETLKHDYSLIGVDVSDVKRLSTLNNKVKDLVKNAQLSKVVDWGRRKMHEVSFWEKTSPFRLKISDLCQRGKKISDMLMDILESTIDSKSIKMLIVQLVDIHNSLKELILALSEMISNVKYEGNVNDLISDRYDSESNLDSDDLKDLAKALNRQKRYKLLKELGSV